MLYLHEAISVWWEKVTLTATIFYVLYCHLKDFVSVSSY
jgi:hypothetical protein